MRITSAAAALATATLGMTGAASAATITYYDDEAAYLAAITGSQTITEDFTGNTYDDFFDITGEEVGIDNDRLEDAIDDEDDISTVYSFDSAVSAFGAFWDMTPGGTATGIGFTLTLVGGATQTLTTEAAGTLEGEFFGFTSDVAFTAIGLFEGSASGSRETYAADDFTVALADMPAVPLPAGLPLLLGGVGALAALRRRKAARRA